MRRAHGTRLAVGVVLPLVVLAACGSSSEKSSTSHPSSTSRSSTTTTSSTSTTSTTSAPASTSTTTGTRPPSGPAAVSTLRAIAGGGSGEVELSWAGVPGATRYRVARAVAPSGPFTTIADLQAESGTGTHVPSVVNLYIFDGRYRLVDVPTGSSSRRWYYVVTAASDAGTAPPSGAVCGAPLGSSCA